MVETGGIQFIGATPRTDWLPAEIERDPKGFVRSGAALAESRHWELARPPFLLETSHPGVFVAGDVRTARGIGGGRRSDVGAVRARVSQGDVVGTLRGR